MLTFLRYKRGHYLAVAAGYLVSLVLAAYSFDVSGPVSATDLLVIQPGPEDGVDTMVMPLSPNAEMPATDMEETLAGFMNMDSSFASNSSKIGLTYDLSSIEAGAVVTDATISLYDCANNSNNTPTTLTIHQMTGFGAGGPEYNIVSEDSLLVGANNERQWHNFSVTGMVQDWLNGVEMNSAIINYTATNTLESLKCFVSKDNVLEADYAPKLTVEYESGEPTVQQQANIIVSEDNTFSYIGGMYIGAQFFEPILSVGIYDIEARSLFQFDHSALTDQDIVTSAIFGLCFTGDVFISDTTVSLSLHRITESWDEATATWNNQPNYSPEAIDAVTVGDSSQPGWYSFDVTELLQSWREEEYQDYGFIIIYNSGESEGIKEFYSSDYEADPLLRPKLSIEYQTESEPDPEPESVYHKECQGGRCVDVEGPGDNNCSSEIQCQSPTVNNPDPVPLQRTHKECSSGKCVEVEGEGPDECINDYLCTIKTSDPIVVDPPVVPPEDPEDEDDDTKEIIPKDTDPPKQDPPKTIFDKVLGLASDTLSIMMLIIAGVFSALSTGLMLWSYLSINASLKQYFLALINYFQSLFFLRKKSKKGKVYDSSTNKPISGALVSLYSLPDVRLVSCALTSSSGQYLMLARSGSYAVSVTAKGFMFPSVTTKKILGGDSSQYFGDTIVIKKDKAINYNIPLDPGIAFLPNRKVIYRLVVSSNYLRLFINTIGSLLSIVALYINPSPLNYFICSAYMFLWFLEYIVEYREIHFSRVVDGKNSAPLDLALVRLYTTNGELKSTCASDLLGRVLVESNNKNDYLEIERNGYHKITHYLKATGFIEGQKFKMDKRL